MIDIGVNLTDDMFRGIYNGKQAHQSDILSVLDRAMTVGVEKMMVTGGYQKECRDALKLASSHKSLFCTVGVHPTRCQEFVEDECKYMTELRELIAEGKNSKKVVAIGEFGLDYDRLNFCSKDVQLQFFEKQFSLAEESGLPLFLHMRSAADDFIEIVRRNRTRFTKGVVHSFTGSIEDAKKLLALDLFIGVNGCSLKTQENIQVIRELPVEKLMIETDAPWCDIRSTHTSHNFIRTQFPAKDKKKWEDGFCVKSRNEPCHIIQVLEAVAGIKNMELQALADRLFENSVSVFFPDP